MTPLPLDQLGWGWRSHLSALWWLFLIYRRPKAFQRAEDEIWPPSRWLAARLASMRLSLKLYAHAMPYMCLASIFAQFVAFGLLDLPRPHELWSIDPNTWSWHVRVIAAGIAVAIVVGIGFGIAAEIPGEIDRGIASWGSGGIPFGIAVGIASWIAVGIAVGIGFGIAFGIAVGIGFGIAFGIAAGVALPIAREIPVGIVVGIVVGIAFGIAVGIAYGMLTLFATRAYYWPLHLPFVWPRVRGSWYPWHPVAWDDLCGTPFWRLDKLLVAYAEHVTKDVWTAEIARIVNANPVQRMAAHRASATLVARSAARETKLTQLPHIVGNLAEGEKGFLRQTARLKEWVDEISQAQARLDAHERPVFRAPLAELLCKGIESFRHTVSGFDEPLCTEFCAAAEAWLEIAQEQLRAAKAVLGKEPVPHIFVAGDPVDRDQQAFVPRTRVFEKLAGEILHGPRCPGLLLYGRRRMGKSTALKNVAAFLDTSVQVVYLTMEDPAAFGSDARFARRVSNEIVKDWPLDAPPPAQPGDLAAMTDFLAECNQRLAEHKRRLLIGIDEYEYLDTKIGEGALTTDVLALLSTSIQHHRQIIWVLAGSREIMELQNAQWPSYLISVLTVEIEPFTQAETRLLLTEPLKHSQVWTKDDPRRPRFTEAFWGPRGIERIHQEAGGWPYLVQLIAARVVDLLNNETTLDVTTKLLNDALNEAVKVGTNFFWQIIDNESKLPGEKEYLYGFREDDTLPPPAEPAIARSLKRRLLVSEQDGQWRLRVPLMQRWLRREGA